MRKLLLFIALIGVSQIIRAQKKNPPKHRAGQSKIMPKVFDDLSTTASCGLDGLGQIETYTGTILERQFADDKTTLNGFVINDSENKQILIGLDTRHIENISDFALPALSRFLVEKRRVKVWIYRCLIVRYAFKIQGL